MTTQQSGFAQHVHHDVKFEYCYNLEERQEAIRRSKPANEQALRLSLLRIYPNDRLPASLVKFYAQWVKFYAQWYKLDAQWVKFYARRDKLDAQWVKFYARRDKLDAQRVKLIEQNRPELEALHAEFCPDCPWDEGKETIFTRKNADEVWY